MMLLKMIDISEAGEDPTNEEIRIFFKSLKLGMKLPLFNKYGCPNRYVEQFIAENYLDGLMEGYTLKFIVPESIEYLYDKPLLVLEGRLKRIFSAIVSVIQRRELTLNFEHDFEDKEGLTLHDYPNGDCCNCCNGDEITIGFRIEKDNIKCINYD